MAAMPWEDAGRMAWQNVLLLGFDPEEAEKKHSVAITEQTFLQQQMAGSGLGPHKAMEVVMHFLMLKGLVSEAQTPLKMLFPVVEKQQGRDFRKFVTENLSALQKARELPPSPLIRSTVFDSPCGPKFCQVLFHFSQYAMRRQLLAMKKSAALAQPAFQRQNARSLVRVTRQRVAHERDLFLDHIRRAGAAQEHWTQFAHEFAEAFNTAAGNRAEVSAAQQALMSQELDSDICLDHDAAEAKAMDADKSVRSKWTSIELSGLASASQREAVERLLVNVGQEKSINISEIMRQKLQALDPSAPIVAERLDMEALLQRWAANIGQVHRQLLQNIAGRQGLERLADSATDLQDLAEEAHARFTTAQTLRSQLAADVEAVRRSIGDLRRNVSQRYAETVMDHDASLEEEAAVPSASKSPYNDYGMSRERDHHDSASSALTDDGTLLSGIGSPSSRYRASRGSNRSPSTVQISPTGAAQQRDSLQSACRASPVNSVGVYGGGGGSNGASASTKISELDMRVQHLRKQLASPQPPALSPSALSLPDTSQKRPTPSPLSSDSVNSITNGQAKPSPPKTPPPLYAALRGKRLSNGDSNPATLSPPAATTKTVLQVSEAQSEIERRRMSLRSKLAGALDDDILAPPSLSLSTATAASAGVLDHLLAKDITSPPKLAGKGSVVQDDVAVGKYFDE